MSTAEHNLPLAVLSSYFRPHFRRAFVLGGTQLRDDGFIEFGQRFMFNEAALDSPASCAGPTTNRLKG
jgi:hypothetical protein